MESNELRSYFGFEVVIAVTMKSYIVSDIKSYSTLLLYTHMHLEEVC
jgi:hypothetical protein